MRKLIIFISIFTCIIIKCFSQVSDQYYTSIEYYKGCSVIDSNVIKVIDAVFSKSQEIASFPSEKSIIIKTDLYSEIRIAMSNSYPVDEESIEEFKKDTRIFEYKGMQFSIYTGGEDNGYHLFFEDLDTLIPYKSYYMQTKDSVNILDGTNIMHTYIYISQKNDIIFLLEEYTKHNLLWEVEMYNDRYKRKQ